MIVFSSSNSTTNCLKHTHEIGCSRNIKPHFPLITWLQAFARGDAVDASQFIAGDLCLDPTLILNACTSKCGKYAAT